MFEKSKIYLGVLFVIFIAVAFYALDTMKNKKKTAKNCVSINEIISLFVEEENNLEILSHDCKDGIFKVTLNLKKLPLNLIIPNPKAIVQDNFNFFGLAEIYSTARFVKLGSNNLEEIFENPPTLTNDWVGVSGRYKALMFHDPNAFISVSDSSLSFNWQNLEKTELNIYFGNFQEYQESSYGKGVNFFDLSFFYLWSGLKILSNIFLSLMIILGNLCQGYWWIVIIISCILIKVVLYPISKLVTKFEKEVTQKQSLLNPIFAEINKNYEGEVAHNKKMAAYKKFNISPFFTLKPFLISLLQFPIFIAVFNVLGEMPQLKGEMFLWIEDLSYPDQVFYFPFSLPLFGNSINLLPILMTIFSIISISVSENNIKNLESQKNKKRGQYIMSFGFLILFYPFPSGMVLYWMIANMISFILKIFKKLK